MANLLPNEFHDPIVGIVAEMLGVDLSTFGLARVDADGLEDPCAICGGDPHGGNCDTADPDNA